VEEDRNQEDCKFFGNFIPYNENIVNFWSQKLAWTYYQCVQFAITAHSNCLFPLTLALKTKTCVMHYWLQPHRNAIPTWSKFNPSLGGCTVYYVWEPLAFMTPPKNPLVYERLYV
jgi:hypothetical protein